MVRADIRVAKVIVVEVPYFTVYLMDGMVVVVVVVGFWWWW